MKKLKTSQMTKKTLKGQLIIAIVTVLLLILIALIVNNLTGELPTLFFVLIPLWALWALICLYKFITFGKTYKWYRVINDVNKKHGQVNNYAKLHGEAADDHLWLKETKTGVYFLCPKSDVVDATAEYITKKLEQAALFFAGVISLVILGANVINGGHWIATVAFAIISFVCFTVFNLQKDEY